MKATLAAFGFNLTDARVLSRISMFFAMLAALCLNCIGKTAETQKITCVTKADPVIDTEVVTRCECLHKISSVTVATIIYYIEDLPVTRLRLLTNKSDNIAVPYASLRSLILLLSSIELRLFFLQYMKVCTYNSTFT